MDQKEGIAEDQNGLLTIDPYSDIQASVHALGVIEDVDVILLDENERTMVNNIKKMALRITHQALWEIYHGNFYDQNNESTQG